MNKLDALTEIVKREVAAYEMRSLDAQSYFMAKESARTYAVLVVPNGDSGDTSVMMMAQVIGEQVVIWCDNTDRPLYEALTDAGISRERIVLAYIGEVLPESSLSVE